MTKGAVSCSGGGPKSKEMSKPMKQKQQSQKIPKKGIKSKKKPTDEKHQWVLLR